MLEFLLHIYYLRSFVSVFLIIIGIIMLAVFRKKRALKVAGIVLIAVSSVTIIFGLFNAHLRPQYTKLRLSEEELTNMCEYVISDESHLNSDNFLPNNPDGVKDENENAKYVFYAPNCQASYLVTEYKTEEEAEKQFDEAAGRFPRELSTVIINEEYSVCALPVIFDATFFDAEQGDHKSYDIDIYIKYKNYVIHYMEVTERGIFRESPAIYKLIEDDLLFDKNYTLK